METQERFTLYGEVDLSNADMVGAELARAVETCSGDVVLDCSELTFMDSTGLTMLIKLRNQLADSGRGLRLARLSGAPRTAVEITGLCEILGVE